MFHHPEEREKARWEKEGGERRRSQGWKESLVCKR